MAGSGNPLTGPGGGSGGLSRLTLPEVASGGANPLSAPGDRAPDNMSPVHGAGMTRGGPPMGTGFGGQPNSQMAEFQAQHQYAKAVFDQISKSRNMLDHMRREMDQLTQKGDTVDPQDVIAAAGRVVGHGVNAKEMASILADMPVQGGQGLAAWLAAHDVSIRQQEQHADQILSVAGNRMAAAAFRVLAGHHQITRAQQAPRVGGPLAPRGQGQGQRPVTAPPGMGTTNVLQTQQRPDMEGPAAEEAV